MSARIPCRVPWGERPETDVRLTASDARDAISAYAEARATNGQGRTQSGRCDTPSCNDNPFEQLSRRISEEEGVLTEEGLRRIASVPPPAGYPTPLVDAGRVPLIRRARNLEFFCLMISSDGELELDDAIASIAWRCVDCFLGIPDVGILYTHGIDEEVVDLSFVREEQPCNMSLGSARLGIDALRREDPAFLQSVGPLSASDWNEIRGVLADMYHLRLARAYHARLDAWEARAHDEDESRETIRPGPDTPARQSAAVMALCHRMIRRYAAGRGTVELTPGEQEPGKAGDPLREVGDALIAAGYNTSFYDPVSERFS